MSSGRPSNPSEGTPWPGEKRPPGADQGNEATQASPSPEVGKEAKPPAPGQAAADPAPPAGTPAYGGSSTTGSSGATPPSRASTSIPQVGRPPAKAGISSRPSASAKPESAKPESATPAAGGKPSSGGSGASPSSGSGSSGGGGRSSSPPPPPPPTAPATKSGGGYVAGLLGGVVGAALAVFGGPMLMGPPPLAPEPASRLASVEASVRDLQSLSDNLEPTVRSAVEAAVAEVPSTDGAAIAAVAERLDAASGEVASLTSTLADLQQRLTDEAQRLDDARAAAVASLDEQLASEAQRLDDARAAAVASLEEQLAGQVERLEDARAAAVASLDEQLAGQAELTESVRTAASTEVADARAALTASLDTARATIQSTSDTVAALQEQVDALASAERRAAAASLLVRDIDRSIADGSPFVEPLDRLRQMASSNPELDATLSELQPYAESGVPTIQALRQSLEAVGATDETEAVAGYEWLGKTVDNLTDLVAVRAKGTDLDVATGDLVAADEALREGDLARAIATVEEAAAIEGGIDPAAAEAWLADARARLAAVTAQAQLDTQIRELLTATVN